MQFILLLLSRLCFIFLTLLFFCSLYPVNAQITDLRFIGRTVYGNASGVSVPIPGISVSLIELNTNVLGTAVTDTNGQFEIRIPYSPSCNPTVQNYRAQATSTLLWTVNTNSGSYNGCPAPGYIDFGDLRMIRVESITFYDAYTGQISSNPNTGGGKRIYPDKHSPSDNTVNRRLITACAQITRPDAVAFIHFKVFDPDDPSSNDLAVDFNGAAGNDNRGVHSTPQRNGMTSKGVNAGAGDACIDFIVTMHPGDNFAIAASANFSYLEPTVIDGAEIKDTSGNIIPITSEQPKPAYRTDMLTVWRRLHIEVDSMGIVTNNKVTGTIINANTTPTGTSIFVSTALGDYLFEPGTIVIADVGTFLVWDNVGSEVKTFASLSPQTIIGKPFVLYDDDDFNSDDVVDNGDDNDDVAETSATFSALQPNDSPNKNVFAPAYIMPVYNGGGNPTNNTSNIQFALNLSGNQFTSQINLGRNSGSVEADNFWVAYIQLAYQPSTATDRDPNTGRGLADDDTDLGITPDAEALDIVPSDCSNMQRGAIGSLLFQETIRDIFNVEYTNDTGLIFPHEVGHQFGISGHQIDQTIMSRSLTPNPVFRSEHLHLIRCRVKSPGQP